jgi:hypothetical protein
MGISQDIVELPVIIRYEIGNKVRDVMTGEQRQAWYSIMFLALALIMFAFGKNDAAIINCLVAIWAKLPYPAQRDTNG